MAYPRRSRRVRLFQRAEVCFIYLRFFLLYVICDNGNLLTGCVAYGSSALVCRLRHGGILSNTSQLIAIAAVRIYLPIYHSLIASIQLSGSNPTFSIPVCYRMCEGTPLKSAASEEWRAASISRPESVGLITKRAVQTMISIHTS